jgi:hypothetical protein
MQKYVVDTKPEVDDDNLEFIQNGVIKTQLEVVKFLGSGGMARVFLTTNGLVVRKLGFNENNIAIEYVVEAVERFILADHSYLAEILQMFVYRSIKRGSIIYVIMVRIFDTVLITLAMLFTWGPQRTFHCTHKQQNKIFGGIGLESFIPNDFGSIFCS